MKWILVLGALTAAAVMETAAHASLTLSEVEQLRGYVATETHADRVRALVARPDLTADESGAAMASALTGVPLDARRIAYLEDVVAGAPSAATRPVLAVAVVRGALARAGAVYAQHPADLDRTPTALDEIGRAFALAATQVDSPAVGLDDAARAEIARALTAHFANNSGLLGLEVAEPPAVARVRAQGAIALLDAMPAGPTHRVDVADKLGLSRARRAALVETGLLVLDTASGDTTARIVALRALLDRLPGAREGAEAVFVGDEHATFVSRAPVLSLADGPQAPLTPADSPWGSDADPPPVDTATVVMAGGLAGAAVRDALERRPPLRVQVEHDGGVASAATMVEMLAVDAPRTVDVAAARLLAGKAESAAWMSDALGALAVFAPDGKHPGEGLAVPVGRGDAAAGPPFEATNLIIEPTGAASQFRLAGHTWRIVRDPSGTVTAMRRDGAAVTTAMLPGARPIATEGTSWSGAGLVFARLAGKPRAVIAAGPRVRLVGSSVEDAIAAPAPGDDVAVEADLHVVGGPAGVAVRALPGTRGVKGVSLLVVPGSPPHAVLLVSDGAGAEMAASPPVEIPAGQTVHVRLVAHGKSVEARVGAATLAATVPDDFAHGDVALRAYPGASVEATGWRVGKP